ncbi:MAG TPA: efflux RND transporter periplasmic adaptor subunit [Gemmataceae bacterium]|jgi:multidrug efflux pump subunit AcrA (membrane-fusion protein)
MNGNPLSRRVLHFNILALLAILISGCHKEDPPAEGGGEETHAAPVKWEAAEKADLEVWTELLGTTQPLPNRIAHISAVVGGNVLSLLPDNEGKAVVEGQHLEKGQILVRLDDRVVRASRAKLAAGEAELKELIEQAAHNVELAHLDIDRLGRLQNNGKSSSSLPLVSRIELEKARVALKDAESKYKAARAKEEIARAELKAIDEELELYTLRTPIAGQLGIIHIGLGQTLAAGATVAEVIDLDEIDVLCFVPARTVARLKLDQEVRIPENGEPISDATKAEQGRIVFISDQAQSETGTVAVKARFPNRSRKLRANTLLRVQVLTEKKTDCLTIPADALLEDQEEPAVLVVETEKKKNKEGEEEEEHHVHKYQAKLGLRDRDKHKVEVLALIGKEKKKEVAVEEDTLFVVEGGHGLEDDDLVSLKKEEHEEHKDEK